MEGLLFSLFIEAIVLRRELVLEKGYTNSGSELYYFSTMKHQQDVQEVWSLLEELAYN